MVKNRGHVETLAVHAGREIEAATGAVAPAIHLSTTYERDIDGGYSRGHEYARDSNPNRSLLERALATLEGGQACAAFSSGSAATLAVFSAVGQGGHIVATEDSYRGTLFQLGNLVPDMGPQVTLADTTRVDSVRAALRDNTRLIWVETPSNPLLRISDITAITTLARQHGCRVACDNTFASPVFQQPLALGADLAMHSTTKYISGHGDVVGGAVITAQEDDFFAAVREWQTKGGAIPSAFDCWLLLRSLNTLPLRIRQQAQNAMLLAEFLSGQPQVSAVHYPGLPGHPSHAIAARQMAADGVARFGGVLSFEVKGGAENAMRVAAHVRLFTRATSLGGVESLIEHRASREGPGSNAPAGLLRLAVGIEHHQDLVDDLDQALRAIS